MEMLPINNGTVHGNAIVLKLGYVGVDLDNHADAGSPNTSRDYQRARGWQEWLARVDLTVFPDPDCVIDLRM